MSLIFKKSIFRKSKKFLMHSAGGGVTMVRLETVPGTAFEDIPQGGWSLPCRDFSTNGLSLLGRGDRLRDRPVIVATMRAIRILPIGPGARCLGVVPTDYGIVRPGGALVAFRSLNELREFLWAHGSPGRYDIIEGPSVLWLPGYTAPRRGIATRDPDGVVKLIPDFQRQAAAPR
jgi:hypothetical protein